MELIGTLSALLFFVGFVAWAAAALERHEREHGGLAWFEALARRLPRDPQGQRDRDGQRLADELRAASQRDAGTP